MLVQKLNIYLHSTVFKLKLEAPEGGHDDQMNLHSTVFKLKHKEFADFFVENVFTFYCI